MCGLVDRTPGSRAGRYAESVKNTQPAGEGSPELGGAPSRGVALALGLSCHILWGLFPLYFRLLAPAGPLEVIVHRAFWGLVFCLAVLIVTRHLGRLRAVLARPRVTARLALAGFLVVINWTVYVHAILTDRTTEAALGYFINPLMTVALGLLVLRERISRLQWAALALGGIAVAVLIVGLGKLPWISLALPISFALYSLVKKDVARAVGPVEGMVIETAAVSPILLAYMGYLAWSGSTSFHTLLGAGTEATWPSWQVHLALLVTSGVITMIPLILFAKAAQGLPLGTLGFLQYIGPVMQLLIGVFVFGEVMEPIRWVATGIIWLALVLLSVDLIRAAAIRRR